MSRLDWNDDGGVNILDINLAPTIEEKNKILAYLGMQQISIINPLDLNEDGVVNTLDLNLATNDNLRQQITEEMGEEWKFLDSSQVSGMTGLGAAQQDLGISSGAVGSRQELGRMLESYLGRQSMIQSPIRQKSIYTIDRFDGGLNLNKSPRDLSYWEACQMDELTPSKIGRLIRLGDFRTEQTYDMELNGDGQENYGLHYFKWSDSVNDGGTLDMLAPTNYLAFTSGDGGVDLWNFDDGNVSPSANEVSDMIAASSFDNTFKAVYHSADNRLYVSDANLSTTSNKDTSRVCGIIDRPSYFPFMHTDASIKYNVDKGSIEGDADFYSVSFASQNLYQQAPVAGRTGDGNVCVSGHTDGFSRADTTHGGIYILTQFADITDDSSSTGWGGTETGGIKYYKFFASFLYDNGSETKLTDVTSGDNVHSDVGDDKVTATTTDGVYQKLIVRQVMIDVPSFRASDTYKRIHGARFYYTEVDASGNPIGNDKYLWAELDFRYGFKLVSEFGNWNLFENEDGDGTTPTSLELQSLQVANAANTGTGTDADATSSNQFGTLEISSPPTAFTYYALNLFHQEELKSDLMWKTSTMGNGIAFIANIKYDGRQYPDTMLYSGAGETDAGSAYPMWGTYPVDSNRIDIPGAGGSITAIKWVSNRVLQFRKNALYVVNVEDVLSPRVEGTYQGMGVDGQYAVTETPFGVAWVNENGAYAYNAQEGQARSLTIGRLDTEDFHADSQSKIGYDDRAKMLIIGNYANRAHSNNYAYAYSFITDAWSTWSVNRGSHTPISNFAINSSGYLTGATRSSTNIIVKSWSASATSDLAIDYVTKDIDFGKPMLDKRMYTLYISYTGGPNNLVKVYFRPNGKDGSFLGADTVWYELKTLQDYTDPYGSTGGDDNISISTSASLDSDVEPNAINNQRLAKINLRSFATDTSNIALNSSSHGLPPDYFRWIRSIQLRFKGTAADTFEINDISLVFKEKRLK